MKFTIRDLCWLILLAAVICMTYRHELSFKRTVELETAKKNVQFRSELMQKHRAELNALKEQHTQDLSQLDLQHQRENTYRHRYWENKPSPEFLELPPVKPKDVY